MNLQLITAVLESPTEEAVQALLDDAAMVFWIDWRQEDDTIAEACEKVLRTGTLRSELIEVDTTHGYEIHLHHGDRGVRVPLTYTAADRHITIWSLNELLKPHHEIRLCIDSVRS